MQILYFILLLFGFVCFIGAVVTHHRPERAPRFDLVALGLAFWILVPLIQSLAGLVG
jgi:cell division protein FtsW (lipid II flippase)